MVDEADLPFSYGETPATPTGARPRKHKHVYYPAIVPGGNDVAQGYACPCGAVQDPGAKRRAKSSVRLGKDIERRIERIYGPEKIGERNLPIDHLGRDWKWQSKATRSPKPLWLAGVTEPMYYGAVSSWVDNALLHAARFGHQDMGAVLVRTFVTPRVRTEEYMFTYAKHVPIFRTTAGYVIMRGEDWLDMFGRDVPDGA